MKWLETEHGPFSSPEWQVPVLDPVVCMPRQVLPGTCSEFPKVCLVGAQPVGDELFRPTVATNQFPEKLQRCLAITDLRHDGFEHLALVFDGAPEIVLDAIDLHKGLVKVPLSLGTRPHG